MGENKEIVEESGMMSQNSPDVEREGGSKQNSQNKGGLEAYKEPLLLLLCVTIGAVLGLVFREKVAFLKPVGQIFLNLLFTLLVPLIFFSISASIANVSDTNKVGKLLFYLILIFVGTAAIAAILMFSGFCGTGYQFESGIGGGRGNQENGYGYADCRHVHGFRLPLGHQPGPHPSFNYLFHLYRNGSFSNGKGRRIRCQFSQPVVQGLL